MPTMHRMRRDSVPVIEDFPYTELERRVALQFKRREVTTVFDDGREIARVFKNEDTGRWCWYSEVAPPSGS